MLRDMWAFDIESQKWEEIVAENTIVVHGGLGESNERLGDVWTIELC
jgi:hypothetical protein